MKLNRDVEFLRRHVLVNNAPPDADESVSECVEHFFLGQLSKSLSQSSGKSKLISTYTNGFVVSSDVAIFDGITQRATNHSTRHRVSAVHCRRLQWSPVRLY
ncbi:hypothetical protein CASFOL_026314 [Castilleja foliolosa]